MPSRNQSGKPQHVFQNPSRKRAKSGKKIPNAVQAWEKLCKRETVEGSTKWIHNAKIMARAKLVKMGLDPLKK